MRQHVRTLALCLIAAFALVALVASTASASLPEWGGCEATPSGRYANSACTEKATHKSGSYEWYTGEAFGTVRRRERGDPPKQLSHYNIEAVVGPTTFETTTNRKVECAYGSVEMQLENGNTKGVKEIFLRLHGCEAEGQPCETAFSFEEGELNDQVQWEGEEAFKGVLGFVEGKGTEHPAVGLGLTAFRPQPKERPRKVEILFVAICHAPSIGTVWIGGDGKGKNTVISLIEPVDKMTTEFTQTFSASAPGVQAPVKFETGPERTMSEAIHGEWFGSAWTSSWADQAEGGSPSIEIKAAK